jgi:hypothetical protein
MNCIGFSLSGPRTVRVPDMEMRDGAPDRHRQKKKFCPQPSVIARRLPDLIATQAGRTAAPSPHILLSAEPRLTKNARSDSRYLGLTACLTEGRPASASRHRRTLGRPSQNPKSAMVSNTSKYRKTGPNAASTMLKDGPEKNDPGPSAASSVIS